MQCSCTVFIEFWIGGRVLLSDLLTLFVNSTFVLTLVDRAIIAVWYWLLFLRSYSVQYEFPFTSYICKPLRVKFGNVLVCVWIPNKARTIDVHFQTRISSIEIKTVTETFQREILWRTGFDNITILIISIWHAMLTWCTLFHINIYFI